MKLSLDVSVWMGELGAHPQVNYIQEGYNLLDFTHRLCVPTICVFLYHGIVVD